MKVQQAEQGIPEQGIPEQGLILGQCTQIPHYCTHRPLGFSRTPCGHEFSAQNFCARPFLHSHDLILPLCSLNHRHFARKSQSMDVTFHPLGRFPLPAHLLTETRPACFPHCFLCVQLRRDFIRILKATLQSHWQKTAQLGLFLGNEGKEGTPAHGSTAMSLACHFLFTLTHSKHRDSSSLTSGKAEPFPQNQSSNL